MKFDDPTQPNRAQQPSQAQPNSAQPSQAQPREWTPEVAEYLPSILQPHTSAALISMSRLRRQNRLPNDLFYIALLRKLRIPIWTLATAPRCRSGGRVDIYGDVFFSAASYTRPNKRRAHDAIRDCLRRVLAEIVVTAHYAPHADRVYREEKGLIEAAPSRRPLDVSFDIDKTLLATSSNHCSLDKFGLDVTLVTYEPHSSSTAPRTPEINCLHAHRTGERSKFVGDGYTNKDTKVTISRDQVLEALLKKNTGLCPFTVDHFGAIGERGTHFLFGHPDDPPDPLPIDPRTHPNAVLMDSLLCEGGAPVGLLDQATHTWRDSLPANSRVHHYGGSYLAPTPSTWATQQIGLGIVRSLAQMCLTGMKMALDHSYKPSGAGRRRPRRNTSPAQPSADTPRAPPVAPPPAARAPPAPPQAPLEPPRPPPPRWTSLPSWSSVWTPHAHHIATPTPHYTPPPDTPNTPSPSSPPFRRPPSPPRPATEPPPNFRRPAGPPPPPPGFGPLTPPPPGFESLTATPTSDPAASPDARPIPTLLDDDDPLRDIDTLLDVDNPLDDVDFSDDCPDFVEMFLDDELDEDGERELLAMYLNR